MLTLGLVLAILAPIHPALRGQRGDSFPLSWYPMFSRPRPALESVDYVIALTAAGERHIVHSKHHVRGAMNQARRQLNRLARRGQHAQDLCEQVAQRFSQRRRGTMAEVVQIWFVRGKFDLHQYFTDGPEGPKREKIHWACQVPDRAVFRVPQRGEIYHFGEAP